MSINAALVGFGAVALNGHLPWYLGHPSVRLTAVVEPTPLGRAVARGALPHVEIFPSLESLLASQEVTFVDITAPPAAHGELILTAAAHGVHVICEKPLVTSWQALQDIELIRRNGGPIIAACHNWYFAPAICRGLRFVAAGLIGVPERISFAARRPRPAHGADHWKPAWRQSAREGGGILGDLGYHGLYLTSRIFQRAPASVLARSAHLADGGEGAECAASVELDYGEGKRAELTLSWLSPVRETVLEVCGSHGRLVIKGDALRLETDAESLEERFESLTADSWHAAWIGNTLDWFLRVVQGGEQNTCCWQDVRWSVSALDAAYTSIRSGLPISTSAQPPDAVMSVEMV